MIKTKSYARFDFYNGESTCTPNKYNRSFAGSRRGFIIVFVIVHWAFVWQSRTVSDTSLAMK